MKGPAPILSRVLKADCCSGCGMCASLISDKIKMTVSKESFLRPVIQRSLTDEDDALIGAVCPGMRLVQDDSGRQNHVLWGPVIATLKGYAVDEALRLQASSGGVLSALLCFLLETGRVDFVLEIAASERSPIQNVVVKCRERGQVFRAAGSRYSPSAPLEHLHSFLEEPGRFALVGKPCDIAAVRALSKDDPVVREKIPFLLSFFCAGVPSLDGTREIMRRLGVDETEVKTFRYRGNGWPGFATAIRNDGSEMRMSYAESWGDILSKHVQFRCKICPDGSGGFADIVCGDAWECDERGFPLLEEREGLSLILSRTTAGDILLKDAIAAGYINASAIDINEIDVMQPSQTRRKKLVLARILAMFLLCRGRIHYSGFFLFSAARSAGIWPNMRSFLGMVRRLILKRI